MTIMLTPMQTEEFRSYLTYTTKHYAEEKVKAGTWLPEDAQLLSKQAFTDLLPRGLETPHHHLWSLKLNEKDIVGWLWIHAEPEHPQQEAFIYDFGLYEPYRGKGYAKQALAALDQTARSMGIRKLSLHVFAHNQTARKLYEQTGFQETDVVMSKKI
ncbi:putative N-acetyltransferase YycN [Bacillus subtilis]|uniref:GNAT family N-acetyltransferase n=1 Tax=Bacillus TaxID=1386 RepID=UPI000989298F|nr:MULTISPECIES: GNAT family N-acetyltransferase [Bacillus]MBG8577395.1 acetyltransferase [Bacillus subtilis]MBG9624499.1 acetyltransferase [Bacillus subtilis]MCF7608725.1 GNAT family N-acetyltransferase [Bacillus subtilis]MCF7615207.1 GNAT family N-acetyltransferase [Bacillus subtilis]OOE19800.1 GNAT family N-acetyltransferase [Bacillus subtilis]